MGTIYDCILLDLMLPGGDGLTILEELKRLNKQDGVIIISAKNALADKVKGLKLELTITWPNLSIRQS
jgi:DNA-binding response OmpR family regulator